MTLTEFLLARIAEDEAKANATIAAGDLLEFETTELGMAGPADGPSGFGVVAVNPARVLAECEAKRRIVGIHAGEEWPVEDDRYTVGWQDATGFALRFLALPYADHPDYDESWRP